MTQHGKKFKILPQRRQPLRAPFRILTQSCYTYLGTLQQNFSSMSLQFLKGKTP